MTLEDIAKWISDNLGHIATIKKAEAMKSRTVSIKKLDKDIGKLGKSLRKHLIINIIVATFFFILGLVTHSLISYFSHLG